MIYSQTRLEEHTKREGRVAKVRATKTQKLGRLYGKPIISQMVQMMTDGIIGALTTGTPSGSQIWHRNRGEDSDILEITFNTAWSPPEGVVTKLREKFPDVTFQCFYDEPGCEIAGYY